MSVVNDFHPIHVEVEQVRDVHKQNSTEVSMFIRNRAPDSHAMSTLSMRVEYDDADDGPPGWSCAPCVLTWIVELAKVFESPCAV